MTSCIICGESVDGRVCELHEEDVVFEFQGKEPDQLTVDRYYRGSVDGYAEFGIFVDIGDEVTGLLHKSELDRRLDSIDLDSGETVFVQVQDIRDNGNVDLSWSIRQDESRFRGALVDTPEGDEEPPEEAADSGSDPDAVQTTTPDDAGGPTGDGGTASVTADASSAGDGDTAESVQEPVEATVAELPDHVGSRVRVEGEITSAHQTSGPTVFELRDETGTVECAAFEEAGVRAYPDVGGGDIVRIEGEVERRHGDLQVETEGLVVLEDEERDTVSERLDEAIVERARPSSIELLVDDPRVTGITEQVGDAVTAIRRAIIEDRPVVVRHAATADGYLASVAIERAALDLIRDQHTDADAEYHYFERRPIEGAVYDMDDATRDVTTMLSNRDRHDEQFPLFVFVGCGTRESLDGLELLDVYDARRVVIDERSVATEVAETVDVVVSPGDPATTATVLGTNIAANVNPDVREDLHHLPAVSFWEETPAEYTELAAGNGYDTGAVRTLREAVVLEAYYQSYEDKRELVVDLLFAEDADTGLAEHVSEQYRERMETAVETAEANLERRERDGQTVLVLDTEAYTHRYEFPSESLLLDELFRQHREDAAALVGVGTDEAHIRSGGSLDVQSLVEAARERAPAAALDARGAREGRVEFLSGERETARGALLDALSAEL